MGAIKTVLSGIATSAVRFFPKVVGSLILLFVGWVIGWIIGKIVKAVLRNLKVDRYLSANVPFRPSEVFSTLFSWIIYLVFIQSAVEMLGISVLVSFIGQVLDFIPRVVEAIVIILIGYTLAEYMKRQVEKSKMSYSGLIGSGIFFLTIYIAIALALPLLGIDPTLINNLLLVIVGSFGIGIALAIGFGLKDVVARWAKKNLKV